MKYGKFLKTCGIPHSYLINYKKLKQMINKLTDCVEQGSRDAFKNLVMYELFELTSKTEIKQQEILSINGEAFRKILKKIDKAHLFEPLSEELLPIIYGKLESWYKRCDSNHNYL